MKKIIGIVLIVVSLGIGYLGAQTVSDNEASVEVLGAEVGAADKSGMQKGFIYLGAAGILFVGGIVTLAKK